MSKKTRKKSPNTSSGKKARGPSIRLAKTPPSKIRQAAAGKSNNKAGKRPHDASSKASHKAPSKQLKPSGPTESALRGSLPAVGMSAASATIGLVAVLALRVGALAALPVLVGGAVLMAFFRAYASLADRHTSLERLFRFSHELNGAPATTDVLPALGMAREMLADLSYYTIGSREDFALAYSGEPFFTSNQGVWRLTSRVDGAPFVSGPIMLADGSQVGPFAKLA